MEKNQLDNQFKDRLFNHTSLVDTDTLWGKVEQELDKKKTKRRFLPPWFFIFVPITCLVGTGAVVVNNSEYLFSTKKNFQVESVSDIHPINTQETSINAEEVIEMGSKKEEVAITLISQSNIKNENQTKITPLPIKEQTIQQPANNHFISQEKNNSNDLDVNSNSTESVFNLSKSSTPSTTYVHPQFNSVEGNAAILDSGAPAISVSHSLVKTVEPRRFINEPTYVHSSEKISLGVLPKSIPLSPDAKNASPVILKEAEPTENEVEAIQSIEEIKPPKANTWKISASPYGIGGGFNMNIKDANDTIPQASTYRNLRKETETNLKHFGAGMEFRMEHQSGFYIKSGLEWSQSNSQFKHSKEEIELVTVDQIVQLITYPDGSTQTVIRPVIERQINVIEQEGSNRYSILDLPVSFGYARNKKRIGFFAESGIGMNLSFSSSGQVLGPIDQSFINLSSDSESIFKSSLGLSVHANVGLSSMLFNNVELWAGPYVKHRLPSMASESTGLSQHMTDYGVKFGLRFYLGN